MTIFQKIKSNQLIKNPLWSDRLIFVIILIHLGLNLAQWLILFLSLKDFSGSMIPLRYSILGGVDTLGNWYRLFAFPATGLLIGVINLFLALTAYKKERLISYFLIGVGALLQVLLLVISLAFIKLIRG